MITDDHVRRLIQRVPAAVNITHDADHKCPQCREKVMLFYTLDADPPMRQSLYGMMVSGGFYCANCRWGNAGSMPLDEFKPTHRVMYEAENE